MGILLRNPHPGFAFSDDRSSFRRSNGEAAAIAASCHKQRF